MGSEVSTLNSTFSSPLPTSPPTICSPLSDTAEFGRRDDIPSSLNSSQSFSVHADEFVFLYQTNTHLNATYQYQLTKSMTVDCHIKSFSNEYKLFRPFGIQLLESISNHFDLPVITFHYSIHILDTVSSDSRYNELFFDVACLLVSAKFFQSEHTIPKVDAIFEFLKRDYSNNGAKLFISGHYLCELQTDILVQSNWDFQHVLPITLLNYQYKIIEDDLISFGLDTNNIYLKICHLSSRLIKNNYLLFPSFSAALTLYSVLNDSVLDFYWSDSFKELTTFSNDMISNYLQKFPNVAEEIQLYLCDIN